MLIKSDNKLVNVLITIAELLLLTVFLGGKGIVVFILVKISIYVWRHRHTIHINKINDDGDYNNFQSFKF